MSKGEYVKVAAVIHNHFWSRHPMMSVMNDLVTVFAEDNPNFDPERFRKACMGLADYRRIYGI
jgi:hypothetical protein